MKTNTLLTTAALAGMMFLGQGAMAQQAATERNSPDSATPSQQSNDQSQRQSQSDQSSDSASPAGARSGQRGQSSQNMDQKFVECAAAMDQFEIKAAELAEQQAQDSQIKEFAKQLRQDHEQSGKQLQQIAQQAGIQVSQQLKAPQQAMLQELKQMQGEAFDKAYVYGNVAGHSVAVLQFRDASQKAQNPQLKQFAQQTLPKLQQHLRHAQELAQWDEASAQTAGARERASSPGSRSSLDRSGTDSSSDSATGAGSTSTGRQPGSSGRSNTGTSSGTSDPKSPGSSSSQQGGQNDTGSGAGSDSASGGRNPSR